MSLFLHKKRHFYSFFPIIIKYFLLNLCYIFSTVVLTGRTFPCTSFYAYGRRKSKRRRKERVNFPFFTLSILSNHYFMLFFLYKDLHEPCNALHPQILPQFYYAPSLQSHVKLPTSKKRLR